MEKAEVLLKVPFFGLGKAFMVMGGNHGSIGWLCAGCRCDSSRWKKEVGVHGRELW